MNYVYSTMTDDVGYASYVNDGHKELSTIEKIVYIKGGTNVADKNFVTPQGVVTPVTDEDLELLEKNPVFQVHLKGGFVKVEKKKVNIDKIVKDMNLKDKSRPITKADFKDQGQGSPKGFISRDGDQQTA